MNNEIEAKECQTCRSIGLILAAIIVGLISYYVERSYPIWVAIGVFLVLLAVGMWLVNKFCGNAHIEKSTAKPADRSVLVEPVLTTPKAEPVVADEPEVEVAPQEIVPEPVQAVEQKVEQVEPAPVTQVEDDFDGDGVDEGENEGERPEALSGARDGKADDLKKIKGVGPKLEKTLNTLGFYHFDQLANWTSDEVAWVNANLEGFKGRVTRDDWVTQAKTLAAGGNTAFSKKVDKGDVY